MSLGRRYVGLCLLLSIINYNKILGQGSFDSGVYKNSQQTYQCSLNQKFINQIVTSKNGIKAGKLRDLNLVGWCVKRRVLLLSEGNNSVLKSS